MPKTQTYDLMSDSDNSFMAGEDGPSDDSDFDFDDDIAPNKTTTQSKKATTSQKPAAAKSSKKATVKKTAAKRATKKKPASIDIDIDDNDDFDVAGSSSSSFDSNDSDNGNGNDSSGRPVLSEKCTNSDESDMISNSKTSKQKTVEERYQKLTQLEHILVRPDTYSKSSLFFKIFELAPSF